MAKTTVLIFSIIVCVSTGSSRGPVPEESQEWEQQVPQLAEADLQPAGGGVAALESSPQAVDLWERRLGQQVWQMLTLKQGLINAREWKKKKSICLFIYLIPHSWQSSTRGETEIVQCWDLLKDASQTCAQL